MHVLKNRKKEEKRKQLISHYMSITFNAQFGFKPSYGTRDAYFP